MSRGFPAFKSHMSTVSANEQNVTHIIEQRICFCHESGNSRGMYNFSMIATQARPEGPQVDLELIKAECSNTLQKSI